jgi:S-adenosylmethionine hydrolase
VVVDPGVGSKRRAIAVRTDQGLFVGPDNGVLSLVLSAVGVNVLEVVTLTNPAYQLATVSHTFHGRDIFAPAAAHLANGVPLSKLGPAAINLVQLNTIASTKDDTCQVLHIDHFGNLILNLTAKDIKSYETVTFWLGDYRVESLCTTYADVPEGDFLAYVGSTRQHIEIAIRNGNAAQALGARVGDTIRVFND